MSSDIIAINSDSRYDSWITIGETDGDLNNDINTIGIPFEEWDDMNGLTIINGAIFLMNPDTDMDVGVEIVIGQLTIKTGNMESVVMNFQGKYQSEYIQSSIADNSWKEMRVEFILNPNEMTNCVSWYDGCNTCSVVGGELGACTKLMCFREDTPRCLSYIDSGH